MKKLLIVGHARHGKDTTAEILRDLFGYQFESSSQAASRIFLYDALKDKYGYNTPYDCFHDRVNHRAEWHDLIVEYNTPDKTRLAREIMQNSDMYVGMRANDEIQACLAQGVFDYVIGVYDPRKPLEPADSFNINMWEVCDIVIPNGGSLVDLAKHVHKLKPLLCQQPKSSSVSVEASSRESLQMAA